MQHFLFNYICHHNDKKKIITVLLFKPLATPQTVMSQQVFCLQVCFKTSLAQCFSWWANSVKSRWPYLNCRLVEQENKHVPTAWVGRTECKWTTVLSLPKDIYKRRLKSIWYELFILVQFSLLLYRRNKVEINKIKHIKSRESQRKHQVILRQLDFKLFENST